MGILKEIFSQNLTDEDTVADVLLSEPYLKLAGYDPIELAGFDPSQPRDEHGQWTATDYWSAKNFLEKTGQTRRDTPTVATRLYTGMLHYRINKALRGSTWEPKPGSIPDVEDEKLAGLPNTPDFPWVFAKAFDKQIRSYGVEFKEPTFVYRGLGKTGSASVLEEGKVLRDRGFMSTSFNPATGTGFAWANRAMLKITVPAGTIGLPGTGFEDEMIFPRNTQLEVTRIDPETSGKPMVIHAKMIPPKGF